MTAPVATQEQELTWLAEAMAAQNTAQEAQAARTAEAQQRATQAADQSIAALTSLVNQLRMQNEQDKAQLLERITALEQTAAALRAENAALEALRLKQAKIAEWAPIEQEDTLKMRDFQRALIDSDNPRFGEPDSDLHMLQDPGDCCKPVQTGMQELETLIKERCARPIDTVLDAELQNTDTKKLEALAKAIMNAVDHYLPTSWGCFERHRQIALKPVVELLEPLIKLRHSRVRT